MRRVSACWFALAAAGALGCHAPPAAEPVLDGGRIADAYPDAPGGGEPPPDGGPASSAPRLLAPMSTSTVTQRRPTLHWLLGASAAPRARAPTVEAPTVEAPTVELCADRACTTPLAIAAPVDPTGTSARPVADLPRGWVFWRVHAGAATSATWQLWVGATSASTPVDASSGTIFDVNGDGYPDLLVGAAGADTVHLYLGTPHGLGATRVDLASPDGPGGCANGGTCFGQAVAAIGDVDGDGFADFAIGAWDVGQEVGAAHVYFGGPTVDAAAWNDAGAARRIDLPSPGGSYGGFGEVVAPAGDVDGEGYADFLVAAPGAIGAASFAELYRGAAAPVAADWTGTAPPRRITLANPDGPAHGFWSAAAVGDLDGDGFADFALGSPVSSSDLATAFVHVYRGGPQVARDGGAAWNGATASGRLDLATPFAANAFGGYFGQAVAGVGDVDGDGYTDFVAGAPFAGLGAATLFLGSATPGAADWLATGSPRRVELPCPSDDDYFGFAAAGLGDIDGDGHADFAVSGADDFTFTNAGATHVFLGSALPAAASWNGDAATQRIDLLSVGGDATYYGRAVAGLGDLDGDGFADFGVGARGGDGAAYLYFGGAAPAAAAWTGSAPTGRVDLANPDGHGAQYGAAIQ